MLAYRHAFHAGNHADVLKHIVQVQLMRHMAQKDKGYRIVDTHAGAGQYALGGPEARKNNEHLQGIVRLWSAEENVPPCVADYLQLVRGLDPKGEASVYPGSPVLAHRLLRPQDELRLFELHPADHAALQALLGHVPGVAIRQADGFAALKSQLPPPTRRALVLMDPSYEGQADYRHVVDSLKEALRRFAQGVYMLWYPVVTKPGAAAMLQGLKALAPGAWLHAQLVVQQPDVQGFGLAGSGVFVINPPYTLHGQLTTALPWLVRALAQVPQARHLLEHQEA